jgi:hypothetical protein
VEGVGADLQPRGQDEAAAEEWIEAEACQKRDTGRSGTPCAKYYTKNVLLIPTNCYMKTAGTHPAWVVTRICKRGNRLTK